jgi:hypothetical protein
LFFIVLMKRGILYVLVFLITVHFVSAICIDNVDGGEEYDIFGITVDGNIMKPDMCESTTQLREYHCDTDRKITSTLNNCAVACVGGQCVPQQCNTDFECNPGIHKWCSGGEWLDSGYCDDLTLKCWEHDSTCGSSECTSNACDYGAHKYCLDGEWKSDYYCDDAFCGTNEYSQSYCFCQSDETVETSCKDTIDNDCDGSFDCNDPDCAGVVGCECSIGESKACGVDIGACSVGVQDCVDGSWLACTGVEPTVEICNDLDDDCDGDVDEDCTCLPGDTKDCGSSIGVCQAGVQTCQEGGIWSICFGASYAASQIEDCNGLDDDCDGVIDEGCGCVAGTIQSCGSDVGVCETGTQECIEGVWAVCSGDIEPFPEMCQDLLDNDCDGAVDYEDDNCGEPPSSKVEEKAEETVVEDDPDCVRDIDCGAGNTCSRGECIEEKKEEPISETTTNTALTSSTEPKKEESNLFTIIVPIVIIVLLGLGGILLLMQRKKKKGVSLVKGVAKRPQQQSRQQVVSQQPLQQKVPISLVERKLEESFKKSKKLFGKKNP